VEKRENAFLATIKHRYCLNPGSDKETYHLVLDLEGSGITYHVGDCLGIFPENDPIAVHSVLEKLQTDLQSAVEDRQGNSYLLGQFLSYHANLARMPSADTPLSVVDFCKKLPPLLPRFYSIASSQNVVGNEAHLTVGLVDGTCSHYLCKRAPLQVAAVPLFHHPSRHFSLPQDSFHKPIVMIGPGTGVAPFRAFIQERLSQKCSAKNWLFFGERRREHDFYYRNDWEQLVMEGKLHLDCAFSRDQEEKIYVQHLMLAKRETMWNWLNEGAYLFVCGDASHMAKDVDKALHTIVEQEGKYSPADAKAFIKELKAQQRYQRDIY
jgi:sulfite reductase (NADPH) flavoprotein alpha-component